MPTVSIILPNYNHAVFLEQRISSILHQSYQDFEVIILDDASTDSSREVLARYEDNPKVHFVFNEVNCGSPFKQWNKGVKCAQGEYIWIAESDDYSDPEFLETLVKVLDQHPSVGLAYCQSCSVNQDNEILDSTYLFWTNDINSERWKQDFISSGTEEIRNFLICKNTIPNASAVVFRKILYLNNSKINESFKVAGDWITWVEILLLSDVCFIAKPLNYFRAHSNNVSRNLSRLGIVIQESLRVIRIISKEVQISSEAQQLSFNILFEWWVKHLWSNRTSWKTELPTFLSFLFTYQSRTLWEEAFARTLDVLLLKLRSHLKVGTRLKNGIRLTHR